MLKLLLIGINTRSVLNSALKLNYEIYSASYFQTSDTAIIKNQKSILKEENNKSCGNFEDNLKDTNLIDFSRDYIDEADYIIPVSGVSPSDFKDKNKILSTVDVEDIEDKYKFYKKIKNKFSTPETFKLNDVSEAYEIKNNNPNKKYILKPRIGSGGYDVELLNNDLEFENNEFIMQEYIEGINLSSSVLASKNDAKTICNSRLLTEHDFLKNNKFIYIGNIVPLTSQSMVKNIENIDKINNTLSELSENIAREFNLLGSNGIDYIINEDDVYVIELNPRIQGTFECVEKTLGINLLEAHIMACQGEIINPPEAKCYTYKKIIYADRRNKFKTMKLNNIYDLPHTGSITEKGEPLLTVIDSDKSYKKVIEKVEISSKLVKKHQLSE